MFWGTSLSSNDFERSLINIYKFGGTCLRMIGGWKLYGHLMDPDTEEASTSLCPATADIILAVPSENSLKYYNLFEGGWPKSVPAGINTNVISNMNISLKGQKSHNLRPGVGRRFLGGRFFTSGQGRQVF